MRPLDDWLPLWDVGKPHEARVTATPERALAVGPFSALIRSRWLAAAKRALQ